LLKGNWRTSGLRVSWPFDRARGRQTEEGVRSVTKYLDCAGGPQQRGRIGSFGVEIRRFMDDDVRRAGFA
jgi:hypothetical protein